VTGRPVGDLTVVAGLEHQLFLGTYAGTDILGLFTDPDALSPAVYDAWSRALARRREYFDRRDIVYLTLVVPDAHVVYADRLPAGIVPSPTSPYRRLEERLDEATRAQTIYVYDDLVGGRAEHDTFRATDVQWTDFGAYRAYLRTMSDLASVMPGLEVLDADRLAWTEHRSIGSLGAHADDARPEPVRVAHVLDSACHRTGDVVTEARDGYLVVEQDRPELPTAVVFRDSYMNELEKYFSESFRRVAYVSQPNQLYFDLVELEQPDVVLFETAERALGVPPVEPTLRDFRMTFGDLLLDDPVAVRAQLASRSLLAAGDPAGALAASDQVLARVPPTARLMLHRSRVLSVLDRPAAAVEALRTATSLDPEDAPVRFFLAQALRQRDHHAEAAAHAARAAATEPRHPEFWAVATAAALEAGDTEGAGALAGQALNLHPGAPTTHYLHSQVLVAFGDLPGAEASARRAVELEPAALHLRQLLSVLIQAHDWVEANYCLTRLRALDPDAPGLDEYADLVERNLVDAPAEGLMRGGQDDDSPTPVRPRDTTS